MKKKTQDSKKGQPSRFYDDFLNVCLGNEGTQRVVSYIKNIRMCKKKKTLRIKMQFQRARFLVFRFADREKKKKKNRNKN